MPPTFAEFLTWSPREEILLVELTPALVLSGWTAVGAGAPNSHQVACPALVGTAHVRGGVYRRVVGLRMDSTPMTERASLAACDANAGSWFWDEAAGVLYTRTPSGADPDTFTVASALVRFYLASTGIVLDRVDGQPGTGIYHQPWLVGDVPAIVEEVEDLLFGVKTTPGGQVTATNGHGFWHTVVAPDSAYVWKSKRVTVLLGGRYRGEALPRSAYAPVATMLVDDIACDDQVCTWVLKPLGRLLGQTVPVTPIFETEYPNLGDGVRGTRKWLGYGRAWIPPDLTSTASHGVYTLADAAFQTLTRVHAVYATHTSTGVRTVLVEGVHYTVNLTACTLTIIDPAFAWGTHRLLVDVTGKPGGSRGYLSTFSEITQDLLTTYLGIPAAELDSAAFAAAHDAAPEELSFWLKSPRTVASLLATQEAELPSLGASVFGTVQQTRTGQWTIRVWTPQFDPTGVPRLRRDDLVAISPTIKLEQVYAASRVHYAYDHGRTEWRVATASDARLQILAEDTDVKDVYTFLRNAGDADVLVTRVQFLLAHARLAIGFSERGTVLATANAGDQVLVTASPMPVAAGAFVDTVCELTRIERRFAPVVTLSGVLEDLDGLDGLPRTIGRWMADAAPSWGSATPAERAASGFWCDDNDRADSSDAASALVSRWW